ncbi:N-acetylmuramoyl-L-alanine amidase CwlD [Gorillibacterium timonense]|uniref:N-acetylmuramoyl-L-alanine amidase CwlD n=1 Tax=Gorillibacterium timonense TaxID=1689269 RepID=UPI00071D6B36|nr:N-acetylmuramoyl-L-alanine amidase CwlD [Gorillibacterium timonense]
MRRFSKRVVIWTTLQGKLKLTASLVLLFLMILVFGYQLPSTPATASWNMPLSGKVIAIDPGHGGPDGGAVSGEGLVEKDVNLAVALYLRDYLQQAGALVVMTRETDKDLADSGTKGYSKRKTEDLVRRAQALNERNIDLFLTIHMNSIPSPKWSGAQAFYTANHPDNAALAALIQDEIRRNLANTDRVAKPVDKTVYLLKMMKVPSVLVELGFLSNPGEARSLSQPSYQQKLAATVYQGVLRYLSGEKAPASALPDNDSDSAL